MATDITLLATILHNGAKPTKIDEVNANTTYIGFCLESCTGDSDPKWLIQRVKTVGTVKTVAFANGCKLYNQKWSSRKTLLYKITESATAEL